MLFLHNFHNITSLSQNTFKCITPLFKLILWFVEFWQQCHLFSGLCQVLFEKFSYSSRKCVNPFERTVICGFLSLLCKSCSIQQGVLRSRTYPPSWMKEKKKKTHEGIMRRKEECCCVLLSVVLKLTGSPPCNHSYSCCVHIVSAVAMRHCLQRRLSVYVSACSRGLSNPAGGSHWCFWLKKKSISPTLSASDVTKERPHCINMSCVLVNKKKSMLLSNKAQSSFGFKNNNFMFQIQIVCTELPKIILVYIIL